MYTFHPSFTRLLITSINCVKCGMRINSAAIFRVKIAWSRVSKQLIPRTGAYKMTATTVLFLSKHLHFYTCVGNTPCGLSPRKYGGFVSRIMNSCMQCKSINAEKDVVLLKFCSGAYTWVIWGKRSPGFGSKSMCNGLCRNNLKNKVYTFITCSTSWY